MKRSTLFVTIALLLFGLNVFGQTCGMVSDEAGIIKNTAAIEKGAASLIDQGADVHVITVQNLSK